MRLSPLDYYTQVWRRAIGDTANWARENLVAEALLAIVVFPISIVLQADANIKSLAYGMLAALAAVGALVLMDGVINLIAAPWRIHVEAAAAASAERTDLEMRVADLSKELEDKRTRQGIASGLTKLYDEAEALLDQIAGDASS